MFVFPETFIRIEDVRDTISRHGPESADLSEKAIPTFGLSRGVAVQALQCADTTIQDVVHLLNIALSPGSLVAVGAKPLIHCHFSELVLKN